jgi:hypothetical protein
MLSVIMLSVVMLSVIMLSVVMLSVMAPEKTEQPAYGNWYNGTQSRVLLMLCVVFNTLNAIRLSVVVLSIVSPFHFKVFKVSTEERIF